MKIHDPKTGTSRFEKRLKRYEQMGHARELTFSCFKGYRFLERDRTRHWFVEALDSARRKWPVDLWAWVIMPEHVHLLVYPREPNVIGSFQGAIKQRVARGAIQWLARHAPSWIPKITVREGQRSRRRFWQPGGGYDRNVDEERTLASMIGYIHANPVRRGLVERPIDWAWSSARWYAGLRSALIEMDRTLPMQHE